MNALKKSPPLLALASIGIACVSCTDSEKEVSDQPASASVQQASLPSDASQGASNTSAAAEPVLGSTAVTPKSGDAAARANAFWNDKMLHDEIKFHNPNYNGQAQFAIENGKLQRAVLANAGITNLECFRGMKLTALDLSGDPVKDLSPLAGQPLEMLYLEDTAVEDLTPLRGAPLVSFYAARSPLHTLSGLEGAPLEEFNIIFTRVADLSPLEGAPLKMVWLTGCPVTDISPLAKCPIVSLTLHQTKLTDLKPLSGTKLQRLHIGETPVTDLSPLAGVPLTRLVFTPPLIEKGIEVIRAIPTMREIGHKFDDSGRELVAPNRFWPAFDAMMAARKSKVPVPVPAVGQ